MVKFIMHGTLAIWTELKDYLRHFESTMIVIVVYLLITWGEPLESAAVFQPVWIIKSLGALYFSDVTF